MTRPTPKRGYLCLRCGHVTYRLGGAPLRCGKCKSPYWATQRRRPKLAHIPRRKPAFHAHLDLCEQCRLHPFGLCHIGSTLLAETGGGHGQTNPDTLAAAILAKGKEKP